MRSRHLLLVLLALEGCVHHPRYPTSWSPVKTSIGSDCSGLSGVYLAQRPGTTVAPWDLAQMLDRIIDENGTGFSKFDFKNVTTVRLQVAAPSVNAVFLAGEKEIGAIELGAPKNSVKCDGHFLKLGRFAAGAAPIAGIVDRESTWFSRTNDGSLVMQPRSAGVGVVYVIPFAGSWYEDWIRYDSAPSGIDDNK